ncbi:MAG: endopeptidase La [Candidatus Yanofskybacteria bacterium]|nr:endopeptidase La [Candidatus Yanofskybacteria bacterium]
MPHNTVHNTIIPEELPLIALKNTVLFPKIVMPLIVQRSKSVKALNDAMMRDQLILFITQKNFEDEIGREDLYQVGTVGRVIQNYRLPDGSSKIDVEGIARAQIINIDENDEFFRVKAEPIMLQSSNDDIEERVLMRRVMEQFRRISEMRSFPAILPEVVYMMSQLKDAEQIVSLVTANLNLEVTDQQRMLEIFRAKDALEQLNLYLTRELDIVEAEKNLVKETKKKIGKMQKEMFLREQLKSIEEELGVKDEQQEYEILRKKIALAGMPKETETKALKELNRLSKMPAFSPEVSYLRTYLDWLVELPWNKTTDSKIDLKEAARILDEDHYGLGKAKERILEYLAVKKQVDKLKGPILCLVGPPGVGKTSIGQSIARALGRKFVRVSLGGLRDEAEIRGHRRTYVGALPGRIIQGIHTAKVRNPVFMLDEFDKIGADFRGDPSAALLEALDPQQNHVFSDHYLEVPFDLSDVLFIATANILDTIPPALRDRLEIIEFPGYSEFEKGKIADKFLIPKIIKDHGLGKRAVAFKDSAVSHIIQSHTREAGVRDLERQLATIVRKITRKLVESPSSRQVAITKEVVHKYLGPARISHQLAETRDEVGVVTGLAWTPVGGEVFSIEVTKMPGKGRLILTGQLGDVMKESAQAGLSYARAKVAKKFPHDINGFDIHIHVPSGAVKKDGPSAGTAITTALVSLFLNNPVKKEVAMTGEVTLRGKILEIGGIKEKILAAHRAGVKTIILPLENKKDMEEIPNEIKKDIKFVYAKTMDDVLKTALR